MWFLLSLALADPEPYPYATAQVGGTLERSPNSATPTCAIGTITTSALEPVRLATASGYVLVTSSQRLDDYKEVLERRSTGISVTPAAALPHDRRETLSVLALVPGARNGPMGWTVGGQPVQVYIDGARISTAHNFF